MNCSHMTPVTSHAVATLSVGPCPWCERDAVAAERDAFARCISYLENRLEFIRKNTFDGWSKLEADKTLKAIPKWKNSKPAKQSEPK